LREYDVIIIGAGPAGSIAARTVAEQGLKTIFFEEHTTVGVPAHCAGTLFNITRPEFTENVLNSINRRSILTEFKACQVYSPSGKVVKEVPLKKTSTYVVERAIFDKELAKTAVKAGSDLIINTEVTGILKDKGRIVGVTTNSPSRPEVYGKLVISADGINAAHKGVAKWEGMLGSELKFTSGISLELTGVKDVDPEIAEFHTGAFIKKGWLTVFPRDSHTVTTHFMSMDEFERVKKGNYALSRKLRNAVPVRIVGYKHAADMGVPFPKLVKDALILAGSGANYNGTLPALASGFYAGQVAAEAIRKGDVTAQYLGKYEDLCKNLDPKQKGFISTFPFFDQKDEIIEERLLQMISRDELPVFKPTPI
jgi:digeranylgeranylglycerophospholipid reductase